MKTKTFYVIFLVLVSSLIITCILPYPCFSSSSILSSKEERVLNDSLETENIIEEVSQSDKIINADWFLVVNGYFKKNITTRIIDVKTGRVFYVKRLGGKNHADIEPINDENTEILKSIYGGKLSWNRRPVWVQIGDKFFAGSINGYLHGYSEFNNKEKGHICLHFLNSKMHGTNKVDIEHQKAVMYAYNNRGKLKDIIKKNGII